MSGSDSPASVSMDDDDRRCTIGNGGLCAACVCFSSAAVLLLCAFLDRDGSV